MSRSLLRYLFAFTIAINIQATKPKPLQLSLATINELLTLDPKNPDFIATSFWESMATDSLIPSKKEVFEDPGVIIAKKLFDRFCQKFHQPPTNNPIPFIIHLIWLGSEPPQAVQTAAASWKKYHPDWEVKLWTDKDITFFEWSNPKSKAFFDQAKNWAEKSDILRYEILYQFGGIYSDTDVICLKSCQDLCVHLSFFACFEDDEIRVFGRPLVGSAIIGSAKGHPIIKQCLDYSKTAQEAPDLPQHIRSGPGPISIACYAALESAKNENILIFPCSYFYPLPWKK